LKFTLSLPLESMFSFRLASPRTRSTPSHALQTHSRHCLSLHTHPHPQSKEESNAHRSVTAQRTSTFAGVFWHNFTSMVGAGVLGLS